MKSWQCVAAAVLLAPCAVSVNTANVTSAVSASITQQSMYFNGEPCSISAYNINGANYFKLRDLAQLLRTSTARFSIAVDDAGYSINLTTGGVYVSRGDELSALNAQSANVTPSVWKLSVNGATVSVAAYTIDGSNYYKIRDLGSAIGFGVSYDAASNSVQITTPFSAEVPESTAVDPSWFNDAVFFGDSISSWLSYYKDTNGLGSATFLTATSFGIENALAPVTSNSLHPSYQGVKMKVEDAVVQCGAKKVYLLFGLNDIDYGVEKASADYVRLVNGIVAKSPTVQIYIQSATPMLSVSKRATEKLNNATIQSFNTAMKTYCQANGWNYLDIYGVFADANGGLRPDVCSDASTMGLHISYQATAEWVNYLRTHTRS